MREKLADYAHETWTGWMRHIFSVSRWQPVGMIEGTQMHNGDWVVIIPAWAVRNWTRQMAISYSHLSESEKDLDRAEADKILEIVRESQGRS